MKKILGLIVIFICTITLVTGCGCSKKVEKEEQISEEEIKVNTNENVIKNQSLGALTFSNTSLVYEDGNSKLQTTVTNTSSEKIYLSEFLIHVKDAEGNEIITMTGFVGDSIDANSSKIIDTVYSEDLTNSASIEYEIIK